MYSPKIDESLIPKLYRYAKAIGKPMTKTVDSILRDFLEGVEVGELTANVQKTVKEKVFTVMN